MFAANLHFPAVKQASTQSIPSPPQSAGLCCAATVSLKGDALSHQLLHHQQNGFGTAQAERLRPAHAVLAYSYHDGFSPRCASVFAIRAPFSVPLCLGKGTQQLFHGEVTTKH